MRRIPSALRHRVVPYLVLVLGVLITALVALRQAANARLAAELRFQTATGELATAIQARVEIYVALLRSTSAALQAPALREPEAFRQYVSTLQVDTYYPGIQGIGFARAVERDLADVVTAELRGQGRPSFHIWPRITGPRGYPIVLLEPMNERNAAAIGYDMFSDPIRHVAMAAAAERGSPVASGRVTLVQEIDERKQAGFLIYLPLYAPASPARESELLGFVYSPFRADDLFNGIESPSAFSDLHYEVYDGSNPEEPARLHASGPRPSSKKLRRAELPLEVAGRPWTLVTTALTAERTDRALAWIGASGLTVTLLLSLLVRKLAAEREESLRHAQQLETSEQAARANERLKRAIFDASLDAIITLDAQGRVIDLNPAAERIFAAPRDAVLNQSLHAWLNLPSNLAADGGESGAAARSSLRRVLEARRSDGSVFPAELAVQRIGWGGQSLLTIFLRDITDQVQAAAQIQELTDRLEQRVRARTAELEYANRQLEAFSYSVSHDLRAPARHVLGYAELLTRQIAGWSDPGAQRLLRIITDSARRMARLIDDLLDFSRNSRQELRRESVNMQQLVEETIRTLRPDCQGRRIEWNIGTLPPVVGDRSLLAQVWINLLANAIKYTRLRDVAEITVRAESVPNGVRFSIQDNGTGFDMQYVGKLFAVFSRLHREDEFEGTGIGLANVARIVERHGGTVAADGALGVGATFSFTLPEAPPFSGPSRSGATDS